MAIPRLALKTILVVSNNFMRTTSYHHFAVKHSLLASNIQFTCKICNILSHVTRSISSSTVSSSGREGTPFALHKDGHGYFDFKELESNASVESRKNHFVVLMYETFYLSEEEAHEVMDAHPFLWKEFFHKSFSFLKGVGLEKTTFMRYPWLVAIPPEEIEAKLQIIEQKHHDLGNINIGTTLLKLSASKLKILIDLWEEETTGTQYSTKFHYLEEELEVPLFEVMYLVEPKPFLLTLPFSRIKESVSICLEAGIQKEDLMRDMWVLRNRSSKLRNRIEILQQVKVPIKPWVLRATLSAFETYIKEYWQMRIDMEDHPSTESFLATRLKCDISQAEKMIKSFPGLKRASVSKMKRILDYLLIEKNLDPVMVINTPRILCQKLETVKARIERLEAMHINYSSFWPVCLKDALFDDFTRRWGCEK